MCGPRPVKRPVPISLPVADCEEQPAVDPRAPIFYNVPPTSRAGGGCFSCPTRLRCFKGPSTDQAVAAIAGSCPQHVHGRGLQDVNGAELERGAASASQQGGTATAGAGLCCPGRGESPPLGTSTFSGVLQGRAVIDSGQPAVCNGPKNNLGHSNMLRRRGVSTRICCGAHGPKASSAEVFAAPSKKKGALHPIIDVWGAAHGSGRAGSWKKSVGLIFNIPDGSQGFWPEKIQFPGGIDGSSAGFASVMWRLRSIRGRVRPGDSARSFGD